MDNVFINKVITIASKEEAKTKTGTNTIIKITDQDGDKYNLFKKKKDGTLSAAVEQMKAMDLDEGSTVQISYVNETYTGSDGKEHATKKVTGFRETNEQAAKGQAVSPRPQAAKTTYHKEEEFKPRNFKQEGLEKCLWNYWLEATIAGKPLPSNWMDLVKQSFDAIGKYAEISFATGWAKAQATFEKPFIEASDEPMPIETGEPQYDEGYEFDKAVGDR